MTKDDPDRLERSIELCAPRARVWKAISNPSEFAAWFGLGEPFELVGRFEPGAAIASKERTDGGDRIEHFCTIEAVEPERRLSFLWPLDSVPEGADPARQPRTRVEFRLEEIAGGTRLTLIESGFAALPAALRGKRAQNDEGWALQLEGISQHILGRVEVKVEYGIASSRAEVFDAVVDPARMSQYFISRGSARMTEGAHVDWEWDDVDAKLRIHVVHVVPNEKIVFLWSATGTPTKVALALSADGDKTKITAREAPFALTQEGVARALNQNQGWTDFCLCLKAYLQHGINLRAGKPAQAQPTRTTSSSLAGS
jgi:uncharacterized protein YndB with AHSA1/START domain